MSPELSRRIGLAYGSFVVTPDERATIDDASTVDGIADFEDMSQEARDLLTDIENRTSVMDLLAALETTE